MYFQRAISEMLEKICRDSAYKLLQSTKMKNIKEDTKNELDVDRARREGEEISIFSRIARLA
jgi:hypothetical protein